MIQYSRGAGDGPVCVFVCKVSGKDDPETDHLVKVNVKYLGERERQVVSMSLAPVGH